VERRLARFGPYEDAIRERLSTNPRMRQLLKTIDRFGSEQMAAIRQTAEAHRRSLRPLTPGWSSAEDAG
jgi:deoxyribodipyrimidine photolyase-like uncharacterized protein